MLIALLIGMVGLRLVTKDQSSDNLVVDTQADISFGGPFALTDEEGKVFTSRSIGNQYRLIYFGFTFCPTICPTELAKMTEALNSLDQKILARIQPIFITIDPDRDTSEVIKDYLTNFHEKFIGLTGKQADIDKVVSAYKVYAAKVQDPKAGAYTMDHSSYIFLMDPEDRLVKIYKTTDTAAFIEADLRKRF